MTGIAQSNKEAFLQAAKLIQHGKFAEALPICEALQAKGLRNPDVCHLLSLAYRGTGNRAAAHSFAKEALEYAPANAGILNTFGLICTENGEWETAIKALGRAIELEPHMSAAHANLGHALVRSGRLTEAENVYRHTLSLNASQVDALVNLAMLLRESGRLHDFPIDINDESLPRSSEVMMVRGMIAFEAGNFCEAKQAFLTAIDLSPRSGPLHSFLGLSLARLGETKEAISSYRRAIELDPHAPEPLINIADALKYSDLDGAEAAIRSALVLNDSDANAHDILGFIMFMRGCDAESITEFDRALELDRDLTRAAFHKAGASFQLGNFDAGWTSYLLRYGSSGLEGSPLGPSVSGPPNKLPDSERVAVWTDQGLGDEILQLGLIRNLYHRNPEIAVITSDRLVPLVQRSMPHATVLSSNNDMETLTSLARAETQVPALSLGQWLRTSWSDFPPHTGYLSADPALRERTVSRYRTTLPAKPLVGISWKSTNQTFGAEKSIELSDLLAVFEDLDCTWINLQYGDTSGEIESLPKSKRDVIFTDSEIDPLIDLDGQAAQIAALDLVITISNTTAHLAGSMGTPVFTLVPRRGPGWLWYWFADRSDSPWYPSMKIFRQSPDGTWSKPLAAAAAAAHLFLVETHRVTTN